MFVLKVFAVPILVVLAWAGLGLYATESARAQTTAYVEGTTACPSVSYWFADGYTRRASKNRPATAAVLVLYSGQIDTQNVVVTTFGTEPVTQVIELPAKKRVVVDLLPGTDSDFSTEVDFSGIGVADLKMVSESITVANGLPLCR